MCRRGKQSWQFTFNISLSVLHIGCKFLRALMPHFYLGIVYRSFHTLSILLCPREREETEGIVRYLLFAFLYFAHNLSFYSHYKLLKLAMCHSFFRNGETEAQRKPCPTSHSKGLNLDWTQVRWKEGVLWFAAPHAKRSGSLFKSEEKISLRIQN